MAPSSLTIATRNSALALVQTNEAIALLQPHFPDTEFLVVDSSTIGDRDLKTPLTDASIPDDFFTREIDTLILSGEADLAMHSAKDLPETLTDGIAVAALFPAHDIRDAMVFRSDIPPNGTIRVIGTSSPRREAFIHETYPDAECKSIRGTIGQRIEQLDKGDYDAVIIAACALERLGFQQRITHYLETEAQPQQGRLAITVRSDNQSLLKALRPLDVRRTAGLIALVGCPADASLLSEKARQYIEQADVIFTDRLIPAKILEQVAGRAIYVGKTGRGESTLQCDIHRQLLHEAEAGKLVVRLHGGDPGILGHLGPTLQFFDDWHLRADVVPAVTSVQLAASRARAPLTHRLQGRSIMLMSGHNPDTYQPEAFAGPEYGNRGIYMGVGDRSRIVEKLLQNGWPVETSVIVGERLGFADEKVTYTRLDELSSLDVEQPAVLLIGPQGHPAQGFTLFVGTDTEPFLKYGPLLHRPFIELSPRPLENRSAFLEKTLPEIDGIIFPSRLAVRVFAEALMAFSDVRALGGKRLLAVGPATAKELALHGMKADAAPNNFGGVLALSEELDDSFKGRYLYPCSDASPTDKRAAAIAESGIELVPEIFYENRPVEDVQLPRLPFSRVLFTSSTTVTAYFERFPKEKLMERKWIAVGTSTLVTIEALGLDGELLA